MRHRSPDQTRQALPCLPAPCPVNGGEVQLGENQLCQEGGDEAGREADARDAGSRDSQMPYLLDKAHGDAPAINGHEGNYAPDIL